MLRTKMKRITNRGDRAAERLAEIETSITGLADNDLLIWPTSSKPSLARRSAMWRSLKWRGRISAFDGNPTMRCQNNVATPRSTNWQVL